MEHLPPPPPHLLHYSGDEADGGGVAAAGGEGGGGVAAAGDGIPRMSPIQRQIAESVARWEPFFCHGCPTNVGIAMCTLNLGVDTGGG